MRAGMRHPLGGSDLLRYGALLVGLAGLGYATAGGRPLAIALWAAAVALLLVMLAPWELGWRLTRVRVPARRRTREAAPPVETREDGERFPWRTIAVLYTAIALTVAVVIALSFLAAKLATGHAY